MIASLLVTNLLAACQVDNAQNDSVDPLAETAAKGSFDTLDRALDRRSVAEVRALRSGRLQMGLAHAAAGNTGNPKAVAQVLAAGADPDQQDVEGRTALHYAIDFQSVQAVTTLLAAGADRDLKDHSGTSPRSYCQDILRDLPDYAVCRIVTR